MIFALAGNQNCGKTTLFNQLTGSNQHVGNFPGVTVERKEGVIRGSHDTVVDLPGIYSMSPYTNEEIVTRDFLIQSHPDGIINIADATNIERNLYLTMQLIELNIPMVLALNMMDEVRNNGGTIKVKALQDELGIPVVPISASKNEGIAELIEEAVKVAKNKIPPKRQDFCSGAVHRAIHAVAHLIEDHAERVGVPSRFAATKLVEGDTPMLELLQLSENEADMVEHSVKEMELELDTDREAAMADMRYTFIEGLCSDTVVRCGESREHIRSVKIDSILTHKYLAIPIFLCIMLVIFWLTFGVIGSFLSDQLSALIDWLAGIVGDGLTAYGINPVVHSLLIDGVFAGVGSVLSFLPLIVILFFSFPFWKTVDTWPGSRLSWTNSFVRLGFREEVLCPCSWDLGVPFRPIMATRTLSSERDRKMTILLTPFMSCSAKLPIYGIFTVTFFPKYRALVMMGLYVTGIIAGIISGLIMKKTIFHGKPVPFVMELPNYRFPSAKSVGLLIWDKAKEFPHPGFYGYFLWRL